MWSVLYLLPALPQAYPYSTVSPAPLAIHTYWHKALADEVTVGAEFHKPDARVFRSYSHVRFQVSGLWTADVDAVAVGVVDDVRYFSCRSTSFGG
jgi:hypothetical protein